MNKIEYPNDCKRIQTALLQYGYEATLAECQDVWYQVSRKMNYGIWLAVPVIALEMYELIEENAEHYPVWVERNKY